MPENKPEFVMNNLPDNTSQEITKLRKGGKLDEAYNLAKKSLVNKDDLYIKRALAWVLYGYLKQDISKQNTSDFIKHLTEISSLEFSKPEYMLNDSCAWQIGKLIFALKRHKQIDWTAISQTYELSTKLHYSKPSEAYSFIFKAFHKGYSYWNKYQEFADWWNFENFMLEDFNKTEIENQKPIMSIAEQAYIAYSKSLLAGKNILAQKNKIKAFIEKLDELAIKYPEYKYTSYYKAKLLLAIGDGEDVLSEYLPFARKNASQFWVWSVLAETLKNKEDKIACLCKALTLVSPPEYLINIRQNLSILLIQKQLYAEAKTEILHVIDARETQGWKIPTQIKNWENTEWYKNATAHSDNKKLYAVHKNRAENLLYIDLIEEQALVYYVNTKQSIVSFIISKQNYGAFKYQDFLENPKVGDMIAIRLGNRRQNNFYKVFTANKSELKIPTKLCRKAHGKLILKQGNSFGFVNDIFVNPELIDKHKLSNGFEVNGLAVLSFNTKKNDFGWKMLQIDN